MTSLLSVNRCRWSQSPHYCLQFLIFFILAWDYTAPIIAARCPAFWFSLVVFISWLTQWMHFDFGLCIGTIEPGRPLFSMAFILVRLLHSWIPCRFIGCSSYRCINFWLILYLQCSICLALVNTEIPLLLGKLVNVIAQLSPKQPRDYFTLVKDPVLKLCAVYFIQVPFVGFLGAVVFEARVWPGWRSVLVLLWSFDPK